MTVVYKLYCNHCDETVEVNAEPHSTSNPLEDMFGPDAPLNWTTTFDQHFCPLGTAEREMEQAAARFEYEVAKREAREI